MAYWKYKLPLHEVCSGALKGRTIRSLRHRITRCRGDDANRLRNYHKLVLMASELRRERIGKLPPAELDTILRKLVDEGMVFPNDVRISLFECAVARRRREQDVAAFVELVLPWDNGACEPEEEFRPFHPCLSSLDVSASVKVGKFRSNLMSYLTDLIDGGESACPQVLRLCEALSNKIQELDILEMSSNIVMIMKEGATLCGGLVSLIKREYEQHHMNALSSIISMRGKTSKSLLVSLCAAVDASTWYNERLQQFELNQATIVEWGLKASSHWVVLEAAPIASVERFQQLEAAAHDYAQVLLVLPEELVHAFGVRLEGALTDCYRHCVHDSVTKVELDVLNAAAKCFAEAASAFPMSRQVNEAQNGIAELQQQTNVSERIGAMTDFFTNVWTLDADSVEGHVERLDSLLRGSAGLELPPDLVVLMKKRSEEFLQYMAATLGSKIPMETLDMVLDSMVVLASRTKFAEHQKLADLCAKGFLVFATIAELEQLKAEDSPSQGLHACIVKARSHLLSFSSAAAAIDNGAAPLGKSVLDHLQVHTNALEKLVKELEISAQAAAKDKLNRAIEELTTSTKRVGFTEAWHKNVKATDSFEVLQKVAMTELLGVDPRDLEKGGKTLSEAARDYKAALELACADTSTDALLKEAMSIQTKNLVLRIEANLMYHLSTETDHENLRAKVQNNIRELRKAGLKEKEQLHIVLYRRAFAALSLS